MNLSNTPAPEPRRNQDILEFYRERILYLLAIAIVIFISPFAVIDLLDGHFALGLSTTAVVACFAIDGIAIHLKKRPPIRFEFLLVPTVAAIAISLMNESIHGALWCYPGVLLCYFVLPRRIATAGCLLMLAGASPLVLNSLGRDIALRFVVSLALTIVVIYIITDVIRELQSELLGQAITDPLTGAYNRRQMEFALDDAIERFQRTGAASSILLIDIDHFKRVNDELGHDAGDRVLKALVLLVKTRSRKLDRLFRMGGEEFLLLLPDTPGAAAMIQAENLRNRIADGNLIKNRQVTVSIGLAEIGRDVTQEAWIKAADTALYKAKESGRNRVIRAPGTDLPVVPTEDGERRVRQG